MDWNGANSQIHQRRAQSRSDNMVSLHNYVDREQSYVKHVFLESYLEALAHKTASIYPHIVYVDGFAGPWHSANEKFEDTSFGIALNALRRAKGSWKEKQADVRMSAFLVERDPAAYQQLARIPSLYPDVTIETYNDDFLSVFPTILRDIPFISTQMESVMAAEGKEPSSAAVFGPSNSASG
jgi:three-Cys-motif partner protein